MSKLINKLSINIRHQLWDQLYGQLGYLLLDQSGTQLCYQLKGQIWNKLWRQLGRQLEDQLMDQLHDDLYGIHNE